MRELTEDAMPGGCHPFYAPVYDSSLVELAKERSGYVVVPKLKYQDLVASWNPAVEPPEQAIDKIVLHIEKGVAVAATVGPDALYTWYFLRDPYGRCIGPAPGSQRRLVTTAALRDFYNSIQELQRRRYEAHQQYTFMRGAMHMGDWEAPYALYLGLERAVEAGQRMLDHITREQAEEKSR